MNSLGAPVPGVTVYLAQTGGSDLGPYPGHTNARGQTTFVVSSATAGRDTLSAYADTNNDGQRDDGEPGGVGTVNYQCTLLPVAAFASGCATQPTLIWSNYQGDTPLGGPTSLGAANLDGSFATNDFLAAADPAASRRAAPTCSGPTRLAPRRILGPRRSAPRASTARPRTRTSSATRTTRPSSPSAATICTGATTLLLGLHWASDSQRQPRATGLAQHRPERNKEVAVNGQYIYWSNDLAGTISRATLIGKHVQADIVTGANLPGALVLGRRLPLLEQLSRRRQHWPSQPRRAPPPTRTSSRRCMTPRISS